MKKKSKVVYIVNYRRKNKSKQRRKQLNLNLFYLKYFFIVGVLAYLLMKVT